MTEPYRLKKMATLVKDAKNVLDLGYSVIPNVYLLNKKVVGLDLIKSRPPSNYTDYRKGDVNDLPKPFGNNSFDAITAGELIEHLNNPMKFLRDCYDTLKPGGKLVISTLNPNSILERFLTVNLSRKYSYDPEHICQYPQRWLIRMFEINGFKNVKVISGGSTIPVLMKNIPFPRPWALYSIVYGEK